MPASASAARTAVAPIVVRSCRSGRTDGGRAGHAGRASRRPPSGAYAYGTTGFRRRPCGAACDRIAGPAGPRGSPRITRGGATFGRLDDPEPERQLAAVARRTRRDRRVEEERAGRSDERLATRGAAAVRARVAGGEVEPRARVAGGCAEQRLVTARREEMGSDRPRRLHGGGPYESASGTSRRVYGVPQRSRWRRRTAGDGASRRNGRAESRAASTTGSIVSSRPSSARSAGSVRDGAS